MDKSSTWSESIQNALLVISENSKPIHRISLKCGLINRTTKKRPAFLYKKKKTLKSAHPIKSYQVTHTNTHTHSHNRN